MIIRSAIPTRENTKFRLAREPCVAAECVERVEVEFRPYILMVVFHHGSKELKIQETLESNQADSMYIKLYEWLHSMHPYENEIPGTLEYYLDWWDRCQR